MRCARACVTSRHSDQGGRTPRRSRSSSGSRDSRGSRGALEVGGQASVLRRRGPSEPGSGSRFTAARRGIPRAPARRGDLLSAARLPSGGRSARVARVICVNTGLLGGVRGKGRVLSDRITHTRRPAECVVDIGSTNRPPGATPVYCPGRPPGTPRVGFARA